MTKKAKLKMLKDIVGEVDYDICNGIFERPEEPKEAEKTIERLLEIVDEHIK